MRVAYLGPFTNSFLKPFLTELTDDDLIISPGMGGHGLVELVEERLLNRKETIVITLDTSLENSDRLIRKGEFCSLYSLPKRRRKSLYDLFSQERKLIQEALEDCNPDLIHAHWTSEYALTVLKSTIPTVITSHDHPKDVLKFLGKRYYPLYLLSNYIIKRAKYITTVSPYVLKYIDKIRTNNSVYIGNPISAAFMTSSQKLEKDYNYDNPIITSVLDWNELKNPKNAILGFNLLLDTFPNAELHLFGRGMDENEACQYWCKENRIERNIYFHGHVKNETLKEHLMKTTLLLHTSRTESFGMVVAEAMTLGVPIIGGKYSGAVPQLLDYGYAGLLADIDSPKSINLALIELLTDFYKRSELGQRAKCRAKILFDSKKIAMNMDYIYAKVIKGEPI